MNHSDYGPIGLLVIQSTSLCNLDCSYCYLPDRKRRKVFNLQQQLPLLLKRIYESPFWGPHLSVLWHAGEPLTLPTGFYDQASTIIRQQTRDLRAQGVVIEQHVQTNATLINDDWCDCFQRNGMVVGVSIDGPQDIHDSHRVFRNGRGSHARTLRGIRILRDRGIAFNAIAVLTADALEQPEQMYCFFRDEGIHQIGFNVEEQEGMNTSSSMQGAVKEQRYREFLSHFWACNERDGFPLQVREFNQVMDMIAGGQRLLQNEMNRPYAILSVDAKGNFSTFDPELLSVETDRYGLFNLGNIRDVSLVQATETEAFQTLLRDMNAGMKRCQQECQYYGFCGGGTGSNKYWEHGSLDATETCACRFSSQIPVDVLLEKLETAPGP